ncbi:unnamed protein product [Rhizoctonia solani]|uniref:Uncharacterized protein n=1 Tax=Rhizoctonia solani TaxID=456999 RepID=A0A8H3AY34_9AGAM|nr:unnamed protein product [Rhizoctonia solani]CAE6443319.1 unnamed protein product [Rhizoctonia solani]
MPIAHRRPGLLHLVMPHPALDQASAPSPSSTVASPHTPRRTPRQTPDSLARPRTSVASDKPRSSIDSWNSVDTNELIWEWKEEELELLSRTLDNIPSHLMTPYVGVIPPPNVLDKLARDIALSRNALEWPHSTRATRVKLHELCRRKTVKKATERRAPPILRSTVEIVPDSAPPRRPLYRQSSMDFLPVKDEATSVTRLSSRLQRADRMALHSPFHPYARPYGSRSPTPPLSESTASRPRTRSSTPSDTCSLRAPSPRRLFRSSATPPPESLKRAPAFGAATVQTRVQRAQSCAPPDSATYSSDEEEKARQASAKRPRTVVRRVPSFLGAPLPQLAPSPEEEILDPLVVVPEDPVFAPTIPASKRKSLPTPRRAPVKSTKPTAPATAAVPTVPTPAPTTTPRTLRRVGTRDFPPPTPARAPVPATPRVARAPEQPRRTSGTRTLATSATIATGSSTERRSERQSRRETDKESQPAQDSSRRIKKKSANLNMKESKPSVTTMRL